MQPSAPGREETAPFTTPHASMDEQPAASPASPAPDAAEASSGALDPLVASAAQRIADVINDFRRELHHRDRTCAHAQGSLVLTLQSRESSRPFILAVAPAQEGDDCAVTVQAALKKPGAFTVEHATPPTLPILTPSRHSLDAEVEKDHVSRNKRKLSHGDAELSKRQRASNADQHTAMPVITKEDLHDILAHLREDLHEDTTETVNHIQRLLRRFNEQWHEHSKPSVEESQGQQSGGPFRSSISVAGTGPGDSFPSPGVDRDDTNASIAQVVRQEAALLSRQIKWVEDCRRVATDVHIKREDTWRTTSASFHDQQRQDRENFQTRMVHDSAMHAQTLNQILNEVKAIGLYAQNMKWETPSYLNHMPNASPQIPTPPAFPIQPPPPAFPTQPAKQAHAPSSASKPSAQRQNFTWKTGRGPGTQNG